MQNHMWVVEARVEGRWRYDAAFTNRADARLYQDTWYANGSSRIRKFIAA